MAILIPSKNIYNISDNNKVLDNKITLVSTETNLRTPNNQYSAVIVQENIAPLTPTYTETNENDHEWAAGEKDGGWYYACAYQKDYAHFFRTQIVVPTEIENGYIDKLYRDTEEGNIIEYTLYGDIYEEPIKSSVYLDSHNANFYKDGIMRPIEVYGAKKTIQSGKTIDLSQMPFVTSIQNPYTNAVIVTATARGLNNLNNIIAKIENDELVIDLYCFASLQSDSLKGVDTGTSSSLPDVEIKGTRRYYEIKQIQLTVFGNTIGIKFENSLNTYGSSDNTPFHLNKNELFQSTALSKEIAQSILREYENGKETAIIKCSIGEYYDDIGDLRISTKKKDYEISEGYITYDTDDYTYIEFKITRDEAFPFDILIDYTVNTWEIPKRKTALIPKFSLSVIEPLTEDESILSIDKVYTQDRIPMTFVEGDVVIPYTMGANGYEEPISTYNDGTAKSFQVVGTNIYYDGAVWQELTLQEVR
jgi:hypothetical protein